MATQLNNNVHPHASTIAYKTFPPWLSCHIRE